MPPDHVPVAKGTVTSDLPTSIDPAHQVISIPTDRWQRWHEIAQQIGNDDCGLAKELRNADAAPTRRNLYWAATTARTLAQWTTGDRQQMAGALAAELENAAAPLH